MDHPRRNRLADESSPYLQQHASNPVEWYPWGAEAFERARAEDKPVFLSIGYSTCHWCHVMAHESFENPEIAALMNKHFINVKLDREERPDIDRVYMAYVQASTGSGGWPMSVWLTPDRNPFFGGTYFPPEDRWGRSGFPAILEALARIWREDRSRAENQGAQAVQMLQQYAGRTEEAESAPDAALIDRAFGVFRENFDEKWGGFGGAPKFPRPAVLHLIWRVHAAGRERGDDELAEVARKLAGVTLKKMVAGGMHDHVGGGFHRYSVDATWHVPHFEKMLYDQGQIVSALVEGFLTTGEQRFADALRDTLGYVRRDLTSPEGAFFSAEDADSEKPDAPGEHGEGAFYVWSAAELRELLGIEKAVVFAKHYGVEEDGNAAEGADPHGEFTGLNILIERQTVAETAAAMSMEEAAVAELLATCRARLFAVREKRPRPHRDDKIVAAWNGLMISGFARAATALGEPSYAASAAKAARFIRDVMWDGLTGELRRISTDGGTGAEAFAEDYACLTQGLIDLYEATFDETWLRWAEALQRAQDRLFWDETGHGYFSSSGRDRSVLVRLKDDHDGAEPAASSVAALNLLRLGRIFGDAAMAVRAEQTLRALAGTSEKSPQSLPMMLCALADWIRPPRQIVLAGTPGEPGFEALAREVRSRFLPGIVVLAARQKEANSWLVGKAPWLRDMHPVESRAAAYFCENFTCRLPVTDPAKLAEMLGPQPT